MKLLITGTSNLSGALLRYYWDPHWTIESCRAEEILSGDINLDKYDVFLNCAHIGFKQCWLLEYVHNQWFDRDDKYIINFSSRAAKPNISKGYMYSTQKAALNHMADLLTYNSYKKYRMTTINLGLLEHSVLNSVSYQEVCLYTRGLLYNFYYGNVSVATEVTYQSTANYKEVQDSKAMRHSLNESSS